jgi:gamma-glutamyltranspeptidase/glutathione hydrolase
MTGKPTAPDSIQIAAAFTEGAAGAGRRVEVLGRRAALAVGHHFVGNAGMEVLRQGGNAIDAGVAMILAANVVEFTSCGFGGEVPTLIYSARDRQVSSVNGNTRAPLAATRAWFRQRGYRLIPPDGFLPAGVPAVLATVVLMLRRWGRLDFGAVARPAIDLAGEGFPVDQRWLTGVRACAGRFREEWPTSADLFLPGGAVPEVGDLWRNPALGRTLGTLADAEARARAAGADRDAALRAVRDAFYRGPIAEEICRFQRVTRVRDKEGGYEAGLLAEEDFADYEALVEDPWSISYRGYDVHKCGPWSQGPVFLQQLALLEGYDLAALGHNSAAYLHLWLETAKLAHADKEMHYGDPDFVYVPRAGLLSPEYAAERRRLIDPARASREQRPGDPYPFDGAAQGRRDPGLQLRPLADRGTTSVRVVDGEGNMFSATPSGGWFMDSPVIPDLGFVLGTRCQMFYLDEGHAKSLEPGKQPTTSLSPSLLMDRGSPRSVFGMPGADRQDQGSLQFLLNLLDFGMGIQEALDAPRVWTSHFPSLFWPRQAFPGRAHLEDRFDPAIVESLRGLGHEIVIEPAWSGDATMAVTIQPRTGTLVAGVTSRWLTGAAEAW